MASAVEGCLYRCLNVVPGRPSRYSNDRREDADISLVAYLSRRFDVADLTYLSWLLLKENSPEESMSHYVVENSPIATQRSD